MTATIQVNGAHPLRVPAEGVAKGTRFAQGLRVLRAPSLGEQSAAKRRARLGTALRP